MVSLAIVSVALVVFVLGAIGADLVFREYHGVPEPADELHHVTTDDGVELGIHHHLPGDGPGDGEPVLLCHGLSVNHRNVAFGGEHGLASYLSDLGYDCWAPDLRGRGDSEVPGESWSFDHYVEEDLPAVIDYIRETTGHDAMHWVGHSMGGMLYYAVAGGEDHDDALASGVTLGSPVQFRRHRGKFLYYLSILGLFSRPVFGFPKRLHLYPYSVRWLAFWLPGIPKRIAFSVLNKSNVDYGDIRRAANECMARVSPRVLLQFCDWIVNDRWKSEDHTRNYRRGVNDIETPTRLIAGAGDHLCPAPDIEAGYEDIPGEKDYVVAGVDGGYAAEYAHVDLVFGHESRNEIFPLVDDWLQRHPVADDGDARDRGAPGTETGSEPAETTGSGTMGAASEPERDAGAGHGSAAGE